MLVGSFIVGFTVGPMAAELIGNVVDVVVEGDSVKVVSGWVVSDNIPGGMLDNGVEIDKLDNIIVAVELDKLLLNVVVVLDSLVVGLILVEGRSPKEMKW